MEGIRPRRTYTEEFKKQMVQLYNNGKPADWTRPFIAPPLCINPNTSIYISELMLVLVAKIPAA